MSDEEFWEQWCGSTTRPVERIKRGAKIRTQDGCRWITYPDEINGTKVIIDMPDNALTKSCDQDRHDACPHRLGGPQEGGVTLKLSLPGFPGGVGAPATVTPSGLDACFNHAKPTLPRPATSPWRWPAGVVVFR